jgi:FMN phosphatase YigB (HAD superfamily)
MTGCAVTFDFHDTIAHCDEWFQIEVRTLPSAYFAWQAHATDRAPDPVLEAAADAAYRRLRLAIHQHGHELPAQRCLLAVAEAVGAHVNPDDATRGIGILMREALMTASPVDGAVQTVRALHDAGIPLGIVSSAVYHPFLEWFLQRHGIAKYFTAISTTASTGYYKSRPEVFWQTLDELGATPEASVHVGDSLRFDVGGARRAGMRTAWLNAKQGVNGDMEPNLVLTTMTDAASALLELLDGRDR